MTASIHHRCAVLATISLLFFATPGFAQPLNVDIADISFQDLPRVTFKACVEENGQFVRGLDSSSFTLLENGILQQLTVRCPDPTAFNSVVLVLDNSGSILSALPKLKEAAARLVDSLNVNDECAIITFGQRVSVLQDFTTNKTLLKQRLQTMVASGGTPLFDASMEATNRLGSRSGNRYAVIITDGQDNLSSSTKEEVIANANLVSAKLYTIAFDIDPVYQSIMEDMAVQTGGEFFAVNRPSELNNVYETIADLITEKCCIMEYYSTSCPDTLRSLVLSVMYGGDMAVHAATYVSPSRPERSELVLEVPDELTPLATGFGFVDMLPPPHMDLTLTLRFTVLYDENLIQLPQLPFSLGTVTQDQNVRMTNVGPGRMRFELADIRPAVATGRLVGFPIEALRADSSRYAAFSITDIDIEGCPTVFSTNVDSTLICQCFQALEAELDSSVVVTAEGALTVPVRIDAGIADGLGMTCSMEFSLSPGMSVVDVRPGDILPDGSLDWEVIGDRLFVNVPAPVIPRALSGTLLLVDLQAVPTVDPARHRMQLLQSELWQRCCPEAGPQPAISILQDGECTFIVRRRAGVPAISVAPHPVVERHGSRANIIVTLPGKNDGERVLLRIADLEGRIVRTVFDGSLQAGDHVLPFDATGLPSGRYMVLLSAGDHMVTHSLLYLR